MEHQNPTLTDANGNAIATRSLLQTIVASNVATVDFTNFAQSNFNRYVIEVDSIIPNTDSQDLYIRMSVSGDFKTGATDYAWNNWHRRGDFANFDIRQNEDDTQINVGSNSATVRFGNDSAEEFDLTFTLTNLGSTSSRPRILWEGGGINDNGVSQQMSGLGMYKGLDSGLNTIDGVRFLFSSIEMGDGLIEAGTFRLYGQE